jgi:hypothetical protein
MALLNKLFSDKLKLINLLCLFFFLIIGFYLRWLCLDQVHVNEWVARDFDRAFNLFDGLYFPLAGPELNNGGRLPGPFMYILLSIPLFFHYSYESIFVFNLILNVGTISLLYWVLLRFFGFYTSVLCTAFFSLNIWHIGAILFPINPVFIFPFTVFCLWFLLEITINKKTICLAGLGITICLGIQFHYSVITYSLAIVFILAIFKIKIRPKVLVISLLLAAICLLPYGIHKKLIHIPNNWGDSVTFENPEPLGLGKLAKIVFIQNTIERVSDAKSFRDGKDHSNNFKKTRWFILSFCFYFMVVTTIVRARTKGIEACKKEIIVLSMFYFPALVYEISKPFMGHYWYSYIFVVPQILIVAMAIISIYQLSPKPIVKVFVSCACFFYLVYVSFHTVTFTQDFLSNSQKNIKPIAYKDSQTLLRTLMDKLNLNPHEFYERVYLTYLNPHSFKQIEFALDKLGKNLNNESPGPEKNCFFIVDSSKNIPNAKQYLDLFLSDNNLIIKKPFVFLFDTGFGSKEMLIYEYNPIPNQACYRNLSNIFLTEKSIRDLLINTKKLINEPRLPNTAANSVLKVKTLELEEKYDTNLKLVFFHGDYIFYNSHKQLPFRFKLKIKEKNGKYFLRADIENYYYFQGPNYKMTDLYVSFINKKNPDKKFSWPILDSGKLNNGIGSVNLRWFREVELADMVDFAKGEFLMVVDWQTFWFEPNYSCCGSKEVNFFNLKTF